MTIDTDEVRAPNAPAPRDRAHVQPEDQRPSGADRAGAAVSVARTRSARSTGARLALQCARRAAPLRVGAAGGVQLEEGARPPRRRGEAAARIEVRAPAR
jgi:hypothetical protein